ncbi:hypothetical protein HAX54_010688 [Datura stramonium]|uniref:Uncharacterized protein n=1 Tax=Datura stramonium TaxID=4076 RepID=A0ABS8TI92_DATST|nr:hypothetical protein [Datura stramonium]
MESIVPQIRLKIYQNRFNLENKQSNNQPVQGRRSWLERDEGAVTVYWSDRDEKRGRQWCGATVGRSLALLLFRWVSGEGVRWSEFCRRCSDWCERETKRRAVVGLAGGGDGENGVVSVIFRRRREVVRLLLFRKSEMRVWVEVFVGKDEGEKVRRL